MTTSSVPEVQRGSPELPETQPDNKHCPICGSDIELYPAMTEVFETLGHLVCEDCHEGELERYAEENGQFGMGA